MASEATSTNFPLVPCMVLKFNQFYYAIGNSPPMNILLSDNSRAFEHVNTVGLNSWRTPHHFDPSFESALSKLHSQETQMRVLCLACGDLRNILYSLAGLGTDRAKLLFVVNDYDTHVIARNILILDAMLDEHNDDETNAAIFSIWFSTGLTSRQYDYLLGRLNQLIQEADGPAMSVRWKWHLCGSDLRNRLCQIWKKWATFFYASRTADNLTKQWTKTQRMRHSTFLQYFHRRLLGDNNSIPTSAKAIELELRSLIKENRIPSNPRIEAIKRSIETMSGEKAKKDLEEELAQHLVTGIFNPGKRRAKENSWFVNPTLFWNVENYDLHYGTDSSAAFPFFGPTQTKTLVELCFDEFKTWIRAVRKFRTSVEWLFSDSDAQSFCTNFCQEVLPQESMLPLPGQNTNDAVGGKETPKFYPGAIVFTHSLKSSHLNSCFGVLTSRVEDRWGVLFISRDLQQGSNDLPTKPMALKESNLKFVEQDCQMAHKADASAPSLFNVVTTSNVADHIGLSTLLLVTRPLLVVGGVLLTTTFLQKDCSRRTGDFMVASLLDLDSTHWPTVFNFRAMGYEGDSIASSACRIGHNEVSDTSSLLGARSNTTVVWIATKHSNVPIAIDSNIIRRLCLFQQLTDEATRLHIMDGQVATLFCRLCTSTELLSSKNRISFNESEREMLKCILMNPCQATENDIGLFSLKIATIAFQSTFCGERTPTPVMYVQLGTKKLAGLWIANQGNCQDYVEFHFLCRRLHVNRSSGRVDLCSDVSLGLTNRLRNVLVSEAPLDIEKLNKIATLLLPQRRGSDRCENELTALGPVTFRIYNETDSLLAIQIKKVEQSSSSIFLEESIVWPISGDKIKVRQNGDHGITVDLRLRYHSHDVSVSQKLVFSCPVNAPGWKYNATDSSLILLKKPYSFFSTIRRKSGYNRFGALEKGRPPSGWEMDGLHFTLTAQFSFEEQRLRKASRNDHHVQLPLLTEVKETLMSLSGTTDLVTFLMMKEPGVGIVGLVLLHQLLFDRESFVPVFDLSVCWLTEDSVREIAVATSHLTPHYQRQLRMSCQEYNLFQNLCNYFRASMDPKLLVEHPGLKHLLPQKRIRSCFRRVLFPPLYPSAAAQEEFVHKALVTNMMRSLFEGML